MLELTAKVDDEGKMRLFQKDTLLAWCGKNKGAMMKVRFSAVRKSRSNPQNSYYWGVVVAMVQSRLRELGHEVTEVDTHEFLKSRFNSRTVEVKDGYYIDVPQPTTDMETTEFMDYLEKIKMFASQLLDIYIPEPGEAQLSFT